MSLNHVPKTIRDHCDLIAACKYVTAQTRFFQVTMERMEVLFEFDVISMIAPVPEISILDHAVLTAYANGYKVSLAHSIREIECEFVFRSKVGTLFTTKVGIESRPHFGLMTMAEREEATTGYVWRGTDQPFSAFDKAPSIMTEFDDAANDNTNVEDVA